LIKTRDGAELRVALADNPQIAGVVKASLSDIKQGSLRLLAFEDATGVNADHAKRVCKA
jgi:hypothetical protein